MNTLFIGPKTLRSLVDLPIQAVDKRPSCGLPAQPLGAAPANQLRSLEASSIQLDPAILQSSTRLKPHHLEKITFVSAATAVVLPLSCRVAFENHEFLSTGSRCLGERPGSILYNGHDARHGVSPELVARPIYCCTIYGLLFSSTCASPRSLVRFWPHPWSLPRNTPRMRPSLLVRHGIRTNRRGQSLTIDQRCTTTGPCTTATWLTRRPSG